ncbi:MAG: EF-P lysine aminoacylase EpmA [Chloroflexota bacterium]|nr:EF-P lysine aminoacylase EpmA [Chloroflexota bacterium]
MEPTWLRLRSAPEQQRVYLLRSRVIKAIRAFFDAQAFEEVETPLLVAAPGMEPYLDVFETRLVTARGASARAFLTTSPEYAMKKLLVAGLPRIYQICKSFRNGEEISRGHNPEFTILEWYRAHADYRAIMADCEDLLIAIWRAVHSDADPDTESALAVGDERIALGSPWERLSVRDAFARYASLDFDTLSDAVAMRRALVARGYQVSDETTWEQGYHQLFLNEIEPHLGRPKPTILFDYPASLAALARRKRDDPRYAERFEFYIAGIELGNAFSELTDADEQHARLAAEQTERATLGKTMYDIDADFIRALRVGMPPSAGIAVGVDRLVMLFAGVDAIQETLWFPAHEIFGA